MGGGSRWGERGRPPKIRSTTATFYGEVIKTRFMFRKSTPGIMWGKNCRDAAWRQWVPFEIPVVIQTREKWESELK